MVWGMVWCVHGWGRMCEHVNAGTVWGMVCGMVCVRSRILDRDFAWATKHNDDNCHHDLDHDDSLQFRIAELPTRLQVGLDDTILSIFLSMIEERLF